MKLRRAQHHENKRTSTHGQKNGGRRRISGLRERRRVAGGALDQVDEVGHEAEHDREAEEAAEAAEADEGRLRALDYVEQLDLELHRVLAALDGERGVRRQQHAPRAADGHPGDRLAEDRLLAVVQRQGERILARAALEHVVGVHHLRRVRDGDDLLAALGHRFAAPLRGLLELHPAGRAVPQDHAGLLLLADVSERRRAAARVERRRAERRRQVERERGGR